jgi:hypothetical protein
MATPEDQEKRVALRRRVLKAARIVGENGQGAIDCTVRNISETGAQIETDVAIDLPGSFWLCFKDGTTRLVELVWKNDTLIGVRFVEDETTGVGASQSGSDRKSALITRLAEIERQLAALRAEIAAELRD